MEQPGDDVIVLVEWNADYPTWCEQDAARIGPVELHNIVQRFEEAPGAFMIRALEQIERWEAGGRKLRLSVIAANNRIDPEALASRELVARRLVTAMLRSGTARVVLSANDLASANVRAELVRLADSLTAAGPDGAVQVRLRTNRERWTLPPRPAPAAA
jgi:hypothetical protein